MQRQARYGGPTLIPQFCHLIDVQLMWNMTEPKYRVSLPDLRGQV